MYRSNEVSITDTTAVRGLTEQTRDHGRHQTDQFQPYRVAGIVDITGDQKLSLYSKSHVFSVRRPDQNPEAEREFLEALAAYIQDPLVIRSIGHTGLRHMPDAYQWTVTPSGDVSLQSLPSAQEITSDGESPEVTTEGCSDTVYVVVEEKVGEFSRVRRAFDSAEAANSYVDHPDNVGHLFIEQLTVDSEYERPS